MSPCSDTCGCGLRSTVVARSSSVFATSKVVYAIDGKIGNDPDSIFQSAEEMFPWLEIRLPTARTITHITVVNRKDCCGEMFKNVELRVGNDTIPYGSKNEKLKVNTACGHFQGPGITGGEHFISCNSHTPSKYVTLQILEDGPFQSLYVNEVYFNAGKRFNSCMIFV